LEKERDSRESNSDCLTVYMSIFSYLYLLSIWPDDRIGAGEGLQGDQSACLSCLSVYLPVSPSLYLLSIWPDDRIGAGEGLQVDILQGVQVVQGLHKLNFRRSGGIRGLKT
jgi:hypothetical protein